MIRASLLTASAVLAASGAAAQTQTEKQLPKVVVTANRIPQPKDKIGSAVTVITHEQIERSGASQAYDLLKLVPGVNVTRNGGPGATSQVRIRGSNPGQVRVMIDGVFMNDPSSANTEFDFNSVLINDIERIEVLRGPQSSLYGSDAMGGVINIITRKGEGKPKFNALAEGGYFKTLRQAAGVNGSHGDVDYSLQLQNYKTDGFSRVTNSTENDGSTNKAVTGRLGWKANDTFSFDLSGNYSDLKADYDRTGLDGDNVSDKLTLSGRAAMTVSLFEGAWDHIFSIKAADTERDFDEPLSTTTRFSTFDGRQTTIEYQSNAKLRSRDVLTVGLLSEEQEARNTATTNLGVKTTNVNSDFRTNSFYSQYLMGITDTTTLTLGGRNDRHSTFGIANTYRTTLAQEIPATGTILRTSFGTGYKAPTLFQLFHPTFGNSGLRPEESRGYDGGFEQTLWKERIGFGVTGFYNDYTNLINFSGGTYSNAPKATTRGTESEAHFNATSELTLRSSHTYLLSEDSSTHKTLPRRPKHTLVGGVDYNVNKLGQVGMDVRYVSRQWDSATTANRVKPFTTVDLYGSYEVDPRVSVYTRLENLFDREYQEVRNFNAPGFSVYAGVKATY